MDAEPLVRVEVRVSFDGVRRGWIGEVELGPRIQMLIDRGYLRLLGHADPASEAPPTAPETATPPEMPPARPRASRSKRKPTTILEGTGGDSESDPGV